MTAALPPFVVHTAAAPAGNTQHCASCGWTLQDNTPWAEGRVAVMAGDDRGPIWWPTGARIATDHPEPGAGGMTYAVDDGRALAEDERLCAGAN